MSSSSLQESSSDAPPSAQRSLNQDIETDEELESLSEEDYVPSPPRGSNDVGGTKYRSGSWHPREDGERPNRFRGDPRQWRRYTEEERCIATSLDNIRSRDLSIHLYNAFCLKRQLTQEKSTWQIRPVWTTWPMGPREVPRSFEITSTTFAVNIHNPLSSRQELEELLIATTTQEARSLFEQRQIELSRQPIHVRRSSQVPTPSQFVSKKARGRDTFDNEGLSGAESKKSFKSERSAQPSRSASTDTDGMLSKAQKDTQRYGPLAVPTSDDERSTRILRPIVRNLQTELDKVLMGLHQSQVSHHRKLSTRYPSESRSRGDSKSQASSRKSSTERFHSRGPSLSASSRSNSVRSTAMSIDNHYDDDEEDEDDSDMEESETNRSNENETPLRHSFHKSVEDDVNELEGNDEAGNPRAFRSSRASRLPQFPMPDALKTGKAAGPRPSPQKARLNARDWSDVLGMAAITGAFSPQVIARARDRCAALFDETMHFEVLSQRTTVGVETVLADELLAGVHRDGFPCAAATSEQRQKVDGRSRSRSRANTTERSLSPE